jgi:hypothetical protein
MSDFTLSISVLKDLVEAIGAAGDAIKHLTDGFAYLISSGVSGYDQAKARIVYDHLMDISVVATSLHIFQGTMPGGLIDYADRAPITNEAARKARWNEVVIQMKEILNSVLSLLERIERDRSDFVLQPAYVKLIETLRARSSLLQKLIDMEPPNTSEEIALIKKSAIHYRALIERLEVARDELNNYLLGIKK